MNKAIGRPETKPDQSEPDLEKPARLGKNEERKALVREIRKDYLKPNGLIDWKRVWQEHPEWKNLLGADSKRGQARLYGLASYIAKAQNNGATARKKTRRKKAVPVPPLETVGLRPRYSDGIPYCPSCAFHIQPWNRAWNEMKNAA